MAETNTNYKYSVQYIFDTEVEDKTLTKTFSDYNTSVSDDQILNVGTIFVTNQIFADDTNGVITRVNKTRRIKQEITDLA